MSFPLVNDAEIALNEKIANEAAWKTKNGFMMPKKENLNEHPKKPPVSVQDAFKQNLPAGLRW